MTSDKELLQLAAEAAGYETYFWSDKIALMCQEGRPLWNPLEDDGDALRLAVQLRVDVLQRIVDPQHVAAVVALQEPVVEGCNSDTRAAATRRAIVRAAAEIGRAMP